MFLALTEDEKGIQSVLRLWLMQGSHFFNRKVVSLCNRTANMDGLGFHGWIHDLNYLKHTLVLGNHGTGLFVYRRHL